MILQRRGALGFLQDRLLRIGLTLLVFASIFDLLDPPFDFKLNHLWFLYYLMGVCAVASGVAWVISRYGLVQTLARVLAWPARRPLSLGLYLALAIVLTPFARPRIMLSFQKPSAIFTSCRSSTTAFGSAWGLLCIGIGKRYPP